MYSEWVTTQLKGITRKHRLYRLADQWRKFKVDAVQWVVVHGVILHQGTPSLQKSIISRSAVAVIWPGEYALFAGMSPHPFTRVSRVLHHCGAWLRKSWILNQNKQLHKIRKTDIFLIYFVLNIFNKLNYLKVHHLYCAIQYIFIPNWIYLRWILTFRDV